MKACFKCGVVKALDGFYKHPAMTDGHLGKCIECAKADVRKHYAETREQRSAYEAKRTQDPARKAKRHEAERRHRHRHPDRAKARLAVGRAVAKGSLIRTPCIECGDPKVQAHHEDYSKPLVVEWLCFRCHRERHGQIVVSRSARIP